jgi:serine/threonine protein kinase/ankyrin repeat protein
MTPQTIGPYRIVRKLGQGGMGVVYLGFDPDIGREIAIKTLAIDANDPREEPLRLALAREAQAAGRLSHPGIVTVYQMGRDGPTLFIAMEYVAGPTLDDWVCERAEPQRIAETMAVLREVAEALDYAHGLNVVHRDVKPRNILVAPNGRPKVTDFGLAKVVSLDASASGHIVGTPRYISPEQIKAAPVDGRTDQFSLAVIAYEILTGQAPFDAQTTEALIFQILMKEPERAHVLNPYLPVAVSAILSRGLAKKREDRYGNCVQFISALWAALEAAPQQHVPPPPDRSRTRTAAWVAGGAVGLMLAVSVLAWKAFHSHSLPDPPAQALLKRPAKIKQNEMPPSRTEQAVKSNPKPPAKDESDTPDTEPAAAKPVNTEAPQPQRPVHPPGDPEATAGLYAALTQKRPLAVVEELIRRGASIYGDGFHIPLVLAAEQCDTPALKLLLKAGADPNEGPRGIQELPLTVAASRGCLDTVSALLDGGARINVEVGGQTPMSSAAFAHSAPMVRLLLERGGDPNLKGPYGSTPLMAVAASCVEELVAPLLEKGSQIDMPGFQGKTALMESVYSSCAPVMKSLLDHKASVDKPDQNGATPLHVLLAEHEYPDEKIVALARLLLDHGADPNAACKVGGRRSDNPGSTPLMLSIELRKSTPMFQLLLERGGDPMRVDGKGRTTLMYAVEKNNPEVAALMLSKGVPVNVRDKAGTTALGQAKERSAQKEIIEILERAGGVE